MYCFALDSMIKKCVTIMELSEQGKQKETIVFPTEIAGNYLLKETRLYAK